jgi:hypothetical protein
MQHLVSALESLNLYCQFGGWAAMNLRSQMTPVKLNNSYCPISVKIEKAMI